MILFKILLRILYFGGIVSCVRLRKGVKCTKKSIISNPMTCRHLFAYQVACWYDVVLLYYKQGPKYWYGNLTSSVFSPIQSSIFMKLGLYKRRYYFMFSCAFSKASNLGSSHGCFCTFARLAVWIKQKLYDFFGQTLTKSGKTFTTFMTIHDNI